MSPERPALGPGYLVYHDRWGIGLVLSVEGRADRAQAQIKFSGMTVWVVVTQTPLLVVYTGMEASWN